MVVRLPEWKPSGVDAGAVGGHRERAGVSVNRVTMVSGAPPSVFSERGRVEDPAHPRGQCSAS